jgi:hypothetical protein
MQIFRPEDLKGGRPRIKDIPDLIPEPIPKPDIQKPIKQDLAWIVDKIKELEMRIERIEKALKL